MQLTKNFTKEELACRHCGQCDMDSEFLVLLQKFRDEWGKSLIILSGFRCKEHNDKVGGAKTSQHLTGRAVDIDTTKMTTSEKYKFLGLAYKLGFRGIGLAKTFFHLDTRSAPQSVWFY